MANAALLGRQSEDMPRHSSFSSAISARFSRSKSNVAIAGTPGNPLPPLPPSLPAYALSRPQENSPALGLSPKSPKAKHKGFKQSGRPTISHPILQIPDYDSDGRNFTGFEGVHRPQVPTQPDPGTIDALNLGRMVSQTAAEEILRTPKAKEDAKKDKTPRPSPLQRSKQAFMKASRAFAERLSNSGDSGYGLDKAMRRRAKKPVLPDPSSPAQMSSYRRLHQPIAEGENFTDPKIRALMGDGFPSRKLLPVYESMKSKWSTPPSILVDDVSGATINSTNRPGIDFRMNRAQSYVDSNDRFLSFPHQINAQNWPLQSSPAGANRSTTDIRYSPARSSAVNFDLSTRYDDRIPGLEQHPDVEFFASAPVDFCIPSTRLEPQSTAVKPKRLTAASSPDSSIFENDIEASIDENMSVALARSRRSTDPSMRVKRKSVTEDPRFEVDPAQKRAKRISIGLDIPREDSGLATKIGRLDTRDHHVLVRKDTNTMYETADEDEMMPMGSAMTEPGMFGTSVGKEPMPKEPMTEMADMAWPLQGRPTRPKRNSNPRPRGAIFNRGSWGQTPLISTGEDDSMEIDEVQTNDMMYQMGTNMI